MKAFKVLLLSISLLGAIDLSAQKAPPINGETGLVTYQGTRSVDLKNKKVMMQGMNDWVSKKLDYPPMVFSIIKKEKKQLEVKAMTEVPSSNGLHPVTFRLILIPGKGNFEFVANQFYFEDINLSLEQWLEKYGKSSNNRHQRNYELIITGIESHIFLSMNKLEAIFDKQ